MVLNADYVHLFFIPIFSNIEPGLLLLFENVAGVWCFWGHSVNRPMKLYGLRIIHLPSCLLCFHRFTYLFFGFLNP